jgi:SOS-response transcriptional repressor LexA
MVSDREKPLTDNQLKAFLFIVEVHGATGRPPTLRQIADFMGWRSVATASGIVHALVRRGKIRKRKTGRIALRKDSNP